MLRFRDEKTDEDILCELGKIKQKATSVRKYVEKLKDLTRQLEAQPSYKNLRAWFLNGSSNKRLKSAEITNATTSFEELVARALKMESSKKKQKRRASMRVSHQLTRVQEVRSQVIPTGRKSTKLVEGSPVRKTVQSPLIQRKMIRENMERKRQVRSL